MNKNFLLIILLLVLCSCQGVKDALSGKKYENSDEFLVIKKNPLVLPPNFKDLPTPKDVADTNQIENIGEPGLILTPPIKANKNNDGILTVSEIERLNLNSDIVILSACNTASEDGSPNANGLSGLTSAFFQAGTKSMLVTHWDVETNSAVYLTTKTFEKLRKVKNLSIALQITKNEMMDNIETSHPLFWAPFILIGNL